LGGGGTDLPSYYSEHTGFLIAAAIDKYVYINLHRTFAQEIILKYSAMERVKSVDEVQHRIIRESLKLLCFDRPYLEIASMADIPSGTGLGSSGSFTAALLKALHAHKRNSIHPRDLAEQACHIEIDLLKEPIGKQDQYIAAFGGLMCFTFLPNGQVEASPLNVSRDTLEDMEDNLLLFFTGYSRSASEILLEQDNRSKKSDKGMIENLHYVKQMGRDSKEAIESGDMRKFAELMNTHWEHKKQRSGRMTDERLDRMYQLGRENGAIGGKLIGAGGGGFFMFYAEDRHHLRHAMREAGLEEIRFRFDFEGTKLVAQS
jgi:D-glycero-alpha-D-manno-heptose-7-phosphate kinase